MSKQFSVIGLISVLCLAAVMTACGGTARIEEKSNEAVIVTRPSRVVIETFNGNIEVVTGADDKVAVEVTKFTGAGQAPRIEVHSSSASRKTRRRQPSRRSGPLTPRPTWTLPAPI